MTSPPTNAIYTTKCKTSLFFLPINSANASTRLSRPQKVFGISLVQSLLITASEILLQSIAQSNKPAKLLIRIVLAFSVFTYFAIKIKLIIDTTTKITKKNYMLCTVNCWVHFISPT